MSRSLFNQGRLARFAQKLSTDVEAGAIPGADVLIESRHGFVWRHCCGWRDVVARDNLRENASWRIYSMTKALVSASTMVLVERGLLQLDEPVADFIPAFADLHVMRSDGACSPAIVVPSVRDLLCHTAGLAYVYGGDSPAQRALAADGFFREDLDNAVVADRLAALPLEHQPGTTWHYSHATDVLNRVLEVAAGAPDVQAVLDDTLLRPLGMTETSFRLPPSQASRVAEPLPQALRLGLGPAFEDPTLPRRRQRGNGLVSTMADYACFLRMMLNDGRQEGSNVLMPATVRSMTSVHVGPIARGAYGFGLGVAVRMMPSVTQFPGTVGYWWLSGFGGTYFLVDPVVGFFVILMMQTASAEQRRHYREQTRTMIYAALDHAPDSF